jgi:hypothetical protein
MLRIRFLRHVARLVVDYFDYAARPGASACHAARHAARRAACRRLLRLTQARRRLLHLSRASGCLGTSRRSSRGSSRRSSSTTSPRTGSLSTTSPPSRVRVPRHVARLITQLVAPLVVDYSASHRLVIDYFTYAARLGASTRHAAHRVARCRLFHRASWCLGTSHDMSRGSTSTTPPRAGLSSTISPTPRDRVPRHVAQLVVRLVAPLVVDYSASRRLVVDYFAYAAHQGASARRAARHAARRAARRRLLRLAQARRRLLRLRRASGCLGTLRGSSRRSSSTTPPHAGSSSTTSPTPHVRVPRHVAWLISPLVVDYSTSRRLVVDYFVSAARPGASAHRAARHAACRAAHH